jgi:hypothetical protein
LVLDGFAIKAVAKDDTLHRYEAESVHKWTIASISFITIFDTLAILISLANICILLFLDSKHRNNSEKCITWESVCIWCFFCCCLWKILKRRKRDDGKYDIEFEPLLKLSAQPGEEDQRKTLKEDLQSETITWLLMTSFVAPITCLGTHSGFIVMAWASDPVAAGSMTIFFVLSFVYYYFGIRQLYIVLASRCRKEDTCKCTMSCNIAEDEDAFCCCCKRYPSINDADKELDKYHESLKFFNFRALCIATVPLTVFFMGAHGLSIAAYVLLPSSLVSLPSSLFNVLHWALILGSALIAYKLLTVRPPYQETIAENIVKFYYANKKIPSKEYDKELGQIVGIALNKSYPPPLSLSSSSNSQVTEETELSSSSLTD